MLPCKLVVAIQVMPPADVHEDGSTYIARQIKLQTKVMMGCWSGGLGRSRRDGLSGVVLNPAHLRGIEDDVLNVQTVAWKWPVGRPVLITRSVAVGVDRFFTT